MGYVKTYRNSKNLFDKSTADTYNDTFIYVAGSQWRTTTSTGRVIRIPVDASTTYSVSISGSIEVSIFRMLQTNSNNTPTDSIPVGGKVIEVSDNNTSTFTTANDTKYILIQFTVAVFDDCVDSLMLVSGGVPYSYEAYNETAWYDFCKKKTATGWADSTAQKAPF